MWTRVNRFCSSMSRFNAVTSFFADLIPEFIPESLRQLPDFEYVITFVLLTVLFALIFKVLPRVNIKWRDVWIGAIVTSLLFLAVRAVIGIFNANTHA